jgi:hypothetical protein
VTLDTGKSLGPYEILSRLGAGGDGRGLAGEGPIELFSTRVGSRDSRPLGI